MNIAFTVPVPILYILGSFAIFALGFYAGGWYVSWSQWFHR